MMEAKGEDMMLYRSSRLLLVVISLVLGSSSLMAIAPLAKLQDANRESLRLEGLARSVEIIKDRWGIAHIYAQTEADLFFAQGFSAARDRLFQFEMWRRQAEGTVAEILGRRELRRDIGSRLFKFRGDLRQELNHYHPRGEEIIRSFVRGVNAFIAETERKPELLPIEFELLDIRPEKWTPEIVVSRHQGLLGNIGSELRNGRAVALLGPQKVSELSYFHPGEPDIALDADIDGDLLFDDILGLYTAFRRPIRFEPSDVVAAHRAALAEGGQQLRGSQRVAEGLAAIQIEDIGSNNWVVSGELTQSGYPYMANDPHRVQAVPPLRYWVHLIGPGWNVIGGGEPAIPGVSVGHNEYGAWGLTVFGTDGEDLYVYDTNPDNPDQYLYAGGWEDMRIIRETIPIEGETPISVDLKYTRHGPVVFEDADRHKAYSVRAAWMEPGGAPYLASLRMDQAKSWEEFRDACAYSNIPGENMIWADVEGNIGWQAVGIAPIRRHWSGLVPVPGDGRYEWDGYIPIKAKPHVYNPVKGFWGTANNNLVPRGYPYREAVGWAWSDPFRWARVNEVLGSGRMLSMIDMMRLQTDYLSIPARTLVRLLQPLPAADPMVERARRMLLDWDHVLDKESAAAAIYVAWERRLQERIVELFVPQEARQLFNRLSLKKTIDWLLAPTAVFGPDPLAGRDELLLRSLTIVVGSLREKLGSDIEGWRYGDYKHVHIRHSLSDAVDQELRELLDVGPLPRGGNSYTTNNTGSGNNQTSGASFRIIAAIEDWDLSVGSTAPGQSGDPYSPHYRDLFKLWADDKFFPVLYSRDKIEAVADEVIGLLPAS